MIRSRGHCNTMGTASTMNSLAEALGMTLPGSAAIPAPYRDRQEMAYMMGRRIVEMVWEDLKPRDLVTSRSVDNAIRVLMALGGSTNGIVHLAAIAGRLGLRVDLAELDGLSRSTPGRGAGPSCHRTPRRRLP